MSTPASALGSLAGASGINAVANLIGIGPSTGKGKTTVHAESEAKVNAAENIQGIEKTRGSEDSASTSVTDALKAINTSSSANRQSRESMLETASTFGTEATTGQESSTARSTAKGKSEALETFSGQENIVEQRTLLDVPATMRIINLMLQGDAGIKGLQETAGGERVAGLYNSSTNQLLLDNLLATVGGEVARISAPVVKKEALGETSTKQQMSKEELTDAITEAFSNMSKSFSTTADRAVSSTKDETERASSRSTEDIMQTIRDSLTKVTAQDASSEILKALEQVQSQTMDSKTKTKSKSGLLGLF